jgi:hypothetical protein
MSRFIEVLKNPSTGKYDVNTNANGITDARLGVPAFKDTENGAVFLGYREDFTLVSDVSEFSQVKWWMDQRSGNGSNKSCYTTSSDSFENTSFYEDTCESFGFYGSVSTSTEVTITIDGAEVTIDGTTYNFTPAALPIAIGLSTCTSS